MNRSWFGPAAVIFAATAAYSYLLPHNLGLSDESLFLYEAVRIVDGEVFYRDIFDIITPGSHYLLALVFRAFGVSMSVARGFAAVFHASTAVLVFLACRTLRVPRPLAVVAALSYVGLCLPAWPYASPHWVSTTVTSALLLVALLRPWASDGRLAQRWRSRIVGRPAGALIPGVLLGTQMIVQQQKGIIVYVGFVVLLVIDHLVVRRFGDSRPEGFPSTAIVWLTGGALLVALPVLGSLLVAAGAEPVWQALVEHPLSNYGKAVGRPPWGDVSILTLSFARNTSPVFLKYLPVVLLIDSLRAVFWLWARRRLRVAHDLVVLVVVGTFTALSIMYFPDFIHIAFIAPVLLVALAELVAAMIRGLEMRIRFASAVSAAAVVILLAAMLWQVGAKILSMRREYSIPFQTEFGRIDFKDGREIPLVRKVQELTDESGNREIFAYPVYASLYLMTGTRNPTRYQIMRSNYSEPSQLREAIGILDERRVPIVVLLPEPMTPPDDPMAAYVRSHYEEHPDHPMLWLRKSDRY